MARVTKKYTVTVASGETKYQAIDKLGYANDLMDVTVRRTTGAGTATVTVQRGYNKSATQDATGDNEFLAGTNMALSSAAAAEQNGTQIRPGSRIKIVGSGGSPATVDIYVTGYRST